MEAGKLSPCVDFVNKQGVCGAGEQYEIRGVDCGGCKKIGKASWDDGVFAVVTRKRRPDGKTVASHLLEEAKKPVRSPFQVQAVTNTGKDCMSGGHCAPGYCNWCGSGNACCKSGRTYDPPECQEASGFSGASHYECVSVPQHLNLSLVWSTLGPLGSLGCLLQFIVLAALVWIWRRRSCSCLRKREDQSNLTGSVFVPKNAADSEDKLKMKRLREKAQELDWVT